MSKPVEIDFRGCIGCVYCWQKGLMEGGLVRCDICNEWLVERERSDKKDVEMLCE